MRGGRVSIYIPLDMLRRMSMAGMRGNSINWSKLAQEAFTRELDRLGVNCNRDWLLITSTGDPLAERSEKS